MNDFSNINLIFDNLPVGIICFNSSQKCFYANKYIMDLTGNSIDAILKDQSNFLIKNIHPDDFEAEFNNCYNFLHGNIEKTSICRLLNNLTNEYIWVTNTRKIITNANNSIYMYTVQDVNKSKLLEIDLRNEKIGAEQSYKHKSIFLANMSHEIRTPLNGIIGMLTLLEDTPLSSDQQDYIDMIKECSFNLMTIINDILDFSKLEVGKITLDLKQMNLQKCIESTNDIILSKIYEKSLEYTYNIHPDIPIYFIADSNRIKQILLNLLTNAIKFTDKGSIFLNVEPILPNDFVYLHHLYGNKNINISSYTDNLFIKFEVTDSGCGISSEHKDKLFKSFSQIHDDSVISKIHSGTGLGLVISKQLVELMDGCIWLDWSESSKGSRFSFIIKIQTIDDNEDLLSIDDKNENILKNISVLILDDNLHNRISLIGMTKKWGMRPYAFSNAEEALYFSRIHKFDLGLIDICMPRIDGHTFAFRLREQKEFDNKNFPLIALSSLGDKITSSNNIFKMHLIKPIKETKLKQLCIGCIKPYIKSSNNTQSSTTSTDLNTYIKSNNLSDLKNNIRILLAEDVYINQKVIISFLNKIGYKNINVVENGQQCIDYVVTNDYDIILLDIRMPIMNGEVAYIKIKEFYENKPHKKIPYIIAVTAYCLKEDKQKYLSLGFNDYIPKPVTISDLTRCMDTFIQSLLHD
jgi:signal transduction histidine kinase/CheY-like chemotaxis protein